MGSSPPDTDVALDKELGKEVGVTPEHPESSPSISEKDLHETTAEAPLDPNIVDWEGDDDPHNPLNWPRAKKWRNIAVVASLALLIPLTSTIFAPSVLLVMADFHQTSSTLGSFVVSVFVLGFAIGPLAIGPLSESFGRQPVYLISSILFVVFTIACAVSSSFNQLIVFRFLSGCTGSAPLTLGGATIGDIFIPEQRGKAMAFWGMGPMIGPILGPIAGGFLSQAKGWRWVFWLLTILSGVITASACVFLQETYSVVLLERKAKRLRKETGNPNLRSKLTIQLSTKEHFKRAVIRPLKFLYASPIVFLLSLYISLIFGTMYLLLTTFAIVFEKQYGFKTGVVGLVYIGLGVGLIIGLGVVGRTSDPIYRRLTKRNNGAPKPEFRLPSMMYSGPFVCISLFWYGWSAEKKAHWIVPIIGTVFFGPGMIGAFMSVNTYVVDAYTRYAASAIAATTLLRSLFGALLPLAGPALYTHLGLGWGNSVLAFIALALVPIPWLFFAYGERLRKRFPIEL